MVVDDAILRITLAVIVGTLAAIVYCIRVLILMERRVARIEEHLDTIAHKILAEEQVIERAVRRKR